MRNRACGKTHLILPISFLFYTALIVTTFSMIFYARDRFGASVSLIGWLAALPHLCYFCGCFLLRPVYRYLLPRHWLIASSVSAALLLIGILSVRSLALLFLLYGLFGFSQSLFWPPLMGWLSFAKEQQALNTALGRFNLAWSGGNIVAPFIAGYLLQRALFVPFEVAALIMIAISPAVLLVSRICPRIRNDRRKEAIGGERENAEDRSTPLRYPAWIGLFAAYVILGITMSIFPLYLREEIGFPETRIGALLLLRALSSTGTFVLLARLSFWQFNTRLMIAGQAAIIPAAALLAFARSLPALSLVLAVFGALFALSYNNSLFHGVTGSIRRATRMAVHEGLLTAGMVTGSAIGGVLYQPGSFLRVVLFGCALVAAAVLAQIALASAFLRRDSTP